MTFTLTEVILLVLAAALLVAIVYVVRLVLGLSRAAAEAERFLAHLNQLGPQIDRILAETEGELVDLRRVTQKVDGIADQLGTITQKAASYAAPAENGGGWLSGSLKYITAAMTGARAVMHLFRKSREEQAESAEPELQEEKGT